MGKHYDRRYKDYVAKLFVEEGRIAKQLAYELEIPYSTVGNGSLPTKRERTKV
jgi:transposase